MAGPQTALTPYQQVYVQKGLGAFGGRATDAAAICQIPLPLPLDGGGAGGRSTCFYFVGQSEVQACLAGLTSTLRVQAMLLSLGWLAVPAQPPLAHPALTPAPGRCT